MKHLVVGLTFILLPACSGMTCNQGRHRAVRYMNQGVQKFRDGLHDSALRDLEAAAREDDTFTQAHYNLAKAYQEMKRWDDAQRHLNRVVTLEPENAGYNYDLGVCYQMLGRQDLAMKAYEKALSLNPKLYAAHYRVGTLYMTMDKPKEADAAFRRAIEINPRFAKSFVELGTLYLNHDYPEAAMQVLQAGAAINDNNAWLQDRLGLAHNGLKQYDKAIESFKKALELKSDLHVSLYNLGMTHAAADHRKEAEQALNHFVKVAGSKADIDPDIVRAANEKIFELSGAGEPAGSADAAPPTRLKK